MRKKYFLILLLVQLVAVCFLHGEKRNKRQNPQFDFQKQSGTTSILSLDSKTLDINQISSWFRNDGEFYYDHKNDVPGFEWPKGSGKTAVFSSGFWIGAKVKKTEDTTQKDIRLAVVAYMSSEYRPGRILPDGFPENYASPHLRVYKVRPLLDSPTS